MNKIYVGIDISKEKCNLCYRRGLETVREEIHNLFNLAKLFLEH